MEMLQGRLTIAPHNGPWDSVALNAGGISNRRSVTMALPQRDNYIEQIQRLEGLMAYAEAHGDWAELERLKEKMRRLVEKL